MTSGGSRFFSESHPVFLLDLQTPKTQLPALTLSVVPVASLHLPLHCLPLLMTAVSPETADKTENKAESSSLISPDSQRQGCPTRHHL